MHYNISPLFTVCCTAELSGKNTEIMEIGLLQDESDAATTSLLPLPLLSCGPRSMVPISVPSSSDLESILSPDPIFSDLQLKEINYNAPGNTAWPPDYICINLTSGFDSFKIPYWMCWLHCAYWFIQLLSD